MEEDPYLQNTIKLLVDFTYTDHNYRTSYYTENTEEFEQRYSLDVKGKVLNPNLMVYNADVEFVDADINGTYRESHSNLDKYVFGSTLLRKSRIPLSITASRITEDETYRGEITTDTLAADWYLKFRTLPWTRLMYDKTHVLGTGRNDETESYIIGMSKNIGPSYNSINYSTTDTASRITNYDSRNNVLTIRNDTTFPLKTIFSAGIVRNDILTTAGDIYKKERDITAGSLGLRTTPADGLSQKYNFTFTNTKSDDNTKGIARVTMSDLELFSGQLDYNPSESLNMVMGLQTLLNETSSATSDTMSKDSTLSTYDDYYSRINYKPTTRLDIFMDFQAKELDRTASATSDTKTKSIYLSTGTKYSINSELSTTESINYSEREWTSGDPLTGKRERTFVDSRAALNYAKKLSWSALSAGTFLGHYREAVQPGEAGEAVSSGFNTGLSGIRMNYVTLSSAYYYSNFNSYISDVDRKEQTFTSDAVSSNISYLSATANYIYHTLDSYLDSEDGVENTVGVNASMLYLKRLPITASYKYYTLSRPHIPPSDLEHVYIREKAENTVTATASARYLKWLPISASLSRYTLVQPAIPSATPTSGVRSAHVADKKEDSISLSSTLIYFKNTTASASADYKSFTQTLFDPYSWESEENSFSQWSRSLNGSHTRIFFRGSLQLSTNYKESIKEDMGTNIKEETSNLGIKGTYVKRLSRNMSWKLEAERSYTVSNGTRDASTSGQTIVHYRLRQWLLSAEYLRALREQEITGGLTVMEDKVMLKLSRSFARTF